MSGITFFISSRLKFRSRIVIVSIAVSYIVMIVAAAVSGGFRNEIRKGLSDICGDVQLTSLNLNIIDEDNSINARPSYIDEIRNMEAVEQVVPAVYRVGIVKGEEDIHGVIFKGISSDDTTALGVSIPRRLAQIGGYAPGSSLLTYFVGEKVKVRRFNVISVYDPVLQADDKLVVYAGIADMQRLNGWDEDEASALEIILAPSYKDESGMLMTASEIGAVAYEKSLEEDGTVVALSAMDRYPQLFDWLDLIDFNVMFILVLMTIVAGFNMISGLLILLFENISTIGVLKSMGMTDRSIAKVFLASSASLVLKGMVAGNLAALVFCLIQDTTHLLKLNPENYFVPFVPVHTDLATMLMADVVSFVVIMVLLLIPCILISKVDPARTVRVN